MIYLIMYMQCIFSDVHSELSLYFNVYEARDRFQGMNSASLYVAWRAGTRTLFLPGSYPHRPFKIPTPVFLEGLWAAKINSWN
jgi:hypothetical protein